MKQQVQSAGVQGGNTDALNKHSDTKLGKSPYWPLLLEVATLLDTIAEGSNVYMTVGSTRNRSSFMLSMKGDCEPCAAWGNTLEALIEDM